MAAYRIEVARTAEKQIRALGRPDQERVLRAIRGLATDPFPDGCRKLKGYEDVFRLRVGTFRVLYSVESRRVVIIILRVARRRDVYR